MPTSREVSLSTAMDLMLDAICVVDDSGRFVMVSGAAERIFGYTPEEMIGKPVIDFVYHEDHAITLQSISDVRSGQLLQHFENRYVRKDGRIVHIMWSARWSEQEQLRVGVARDVTERKRTESLQAALYAISEAAHSADDLQGLFERVHQIVGALLPARNFSVALYDEIDGKLSFPYYAVEPTQTPSIHESDSAALSAEVVQTGRPLFLTPETRAQLPEHIRLAGDVDRSHWLGVPLQAKNRTIGTLVVHSHADAVRFAERDIELLQFVSTQIANAIERKRAEVRLQHLAQHDPLTDLPNRELFHDRLRSAMLWARRNTTSLGVLYLDLDNFKEVNDTLGHTFGDLLLQETARRLKACVRESDTVGRIGGDEFLVLLHTIRRPEHALRVTEKIRAALLRPFSLSGNEVCIAPSIGIALYPDHGSDDTQLIRHADEAMYAAKKSAGKRLRITIRKAPSD